MEKNHKRQFEDWRKMLSCEKLNHSVSLVSTFMTEIMACG